MRHAFRAKAVCYKLMLCQEQSVTVCAKLNLFKHECINAISRNSLFLSINNSAGEI